MAACVRDWVTAFGKTRSIETGASARKLLSLIGGQFVEFVIS